MKQRTVPTIETSTTTETSTYMEEDKDDDKSNKELNKHMKVQDTSIPVKGSWYVTMDAW